MKKPMPAWYILLYHDVSWEENCYLRSVGGTCPPDVFRQHVKMAASLGDLVSVADGARMLDSNSFDRPVFSFWFDDGLIGVCKHAKPVLDDFGVTGAVFQEHSLQLLFSQFQECEEEIQGICGRPSLYWVIPFDRKNSDDGLQVADACRGDRFLVYVGNRRNNTQACSAARILFRYGTETSADRLAQRLREA